MLTVTGQAFGLFEAPPNSTQIQNLKLEQPSLAHPAGEVANGWAH